MRVSNVDKHTQEGELLVRLCNYVDVYKHPRITEQLQFMRATAQPDEVERFRLALNDVLITKDSESWDDIGVPSLVAYAPGDLVCGYHVALLRPRQGVTHGPFLQFALKAPQVAHQFHLEANGVTRYGLSHGAIKATRIPLPPIEEQIAAARFLEHAGRGIGRYIQSKQKLIALLNEQKQAIIHRAVTRAFDPNVRLKSSGNRWFPEVPAPWDVLPMRRVIHSAVDGPHFSPDYLDSGIPFLSARNVKADGWSLQDVKYISDSDYWEFSRRVRPELGDVLYTKGGTTGVARAVDLEFPFQVWVHIAVLKVNRTVIEPRFLATALNSPRCFEQSQLLTRGATNQDLGLGRMKSIELPVPPSLEEQRTIVARLEESLRSVLTAVSEARRQMALIREYHTRLIADVVTGKLDVREAAARLPLDEGGNREAFEPDERLDDGAESAGAEEEPEVDLAEGPA